MSFTHFSSTVQRRFQDLQARLAGVPRTRNDLFVTASGDDLYGQYLAAFPDGSNPLVRERTEHDCTSCRAFIRNFGGAVHIDPETLHVSTVWDGDAFSAPYDTVASTMAAYVRRHAVTALFRTLQPTFSTPRSVRVKDGSTETYDHLHGVADRGFVTREGAEAGSYQISRQMLEGAFERLNAGAVEDVRRLIEDGQLYRGAEKLHLVEGFGAAQARYFTLHGAEREGFLAVTALDPAVSRFKNDVIGTLIAAIAGSEDLQAAVGRYEAMVAPANYQRTNQVITQSMADGALKTLAALGVNVKRRLAHLDDVDVNDVVWADRSSRAEMKGGLSGLLAAAVTVRPVVVNEAAVTEMKVDAFLRDVLPQAETLRLLISRDLAGSFMTLTTADEDGAVQDSGTPLLKWNNPFAWSYTGDAADQIQARVKAAGGNIKALLRFSLSWTNTDDLDLRVRYTGKGRSEQLYFRHKTSTVPGLTGGLDVDMNAHALVRDPVENVAFTHLLPGTYLVEVHNYRQREHTDPGFTLQVADQAGTTDYHYPHAVRDQQMVHCLSATVDAQLQVTCTVSEALTPGGVQGGEKWGLPFGQYAEVRCVTLSPNHWGGQQQGNKHTFFILKDAKTDERPRGVYNEYLHPDLLKHRKVLDVIGDRARPDLTDAQLSGVGVSSTLDKAVTLEVTTSTSKRTYRVSF